VVYSRKPPVLRHGQHAQLNIDGDLPIKNGLAERVEGEHIRYRTRAQGGAGPAAPSGAGIGTRDHGGGDLQIIYA